MVCPITLIFLIGLEICLDCGRVNMIFVDLGHRICVGTLVGVILSFLSDNCLCLEVETEDENDNKDKYYSRF